MLKRLSDWLDKKAAEGPRGEFITTVVMYGLVMVCMSLLVLVGVLSGIVAEWCSN